ncbi:MAG TPA: adenylyl-sulfate kinase [Saprospirales bacterium]|nr:adenylyl-sulfate kinase [Saprospirales bacterium]
MNKSTNIHPIYHLTIDRKQRENLLNQKAKVLWFTGLSGSGKSTIAIALEKELYARGFYCYLLDGDNVRTGLCNNLGFTTEERSENIRRISETSKLFIDAGVICINAFVSPTIEIRQMAKDIIGEEHFIEVYVNTPLEVCEARDVKGLYKKARAGEIKNFTGIDAPYEAPLNPQIEIKTVAQSIEEACQLIINQIFNQ